MKLFSIAFSLLVSFQICYAQTSKLEDYKKMYGIADILNKNGHPTLVDDALVTALNELDTQTPDHYFEQATILYEENKLDQAALVFQIALLRYKYYLKQNPDYPPSDNWVTAESFQAAYREKINLYLKTNIDNYIAILRSALRYHKDNDYSFYSKQKNNALYDKFAEDAINLIADFEKNKEKYQQEWIEERKLKLAKI